MNWSYITGASVSASGQLYEGIFYYYYSIKPKSSFNQKNFIQKNCLQTFPPLLLITSIKWAKFHS